MKIINLCKECISQIEDYKDAVYLHLVIIKNFINKDEPTFIYEDFEPKPLKSLVLLEKNGIILTTECDQISIMAYPLGLNYIPCDCNPDLDMYEFCLDFENHFAKVNVNEENIIEE